MARILAFPSAVALVALASIAPAQAQQQVRCESRNFAHNFCGTDARVVSADLVRQNSRAQCVLGRTWGWRNDGIWVDSGCEAVFRVRAR